MKAVLGLRDRENKSESVRLFGSGSAIPNVILVAEIIRARYKVINKLMIGIKFNCHIREYGEG